MNRQTINAQKWVVVVVVVVVAVVAVVHSHVTDIRQSMTRVRKECFTKLGLNVNMGSARNKVKKK